MKIKLIAPHEQSEDTISSAQTFKIQKVNLPLLADALSALITMAIMIGIGYFGGSQIQILKEDLARMNRTIMFSVVLIFLGSSLFRYFRRKNMRLN